MANFDDSPIIIRNTKVPKTHKGGPLFDFLTPNRLLLLGAILIVISMFVPYLKVSFLGESATGTVYEIDPFSAIGTCSYGFFALFAVFFESRWIMIVTFIDCFASTYKVIKAVSDNHNVTSLVNSMFPIDYDVTMQFGFYLYIFSSILLLVGIIWKFKSEWFKSII